jgi:glycosyltransferase involved in cell wall biosynthesis
MTTAVQRVAIVVQRCHADVVGGSEALAWQYAGLLAADYDVELLTSCALDYLTWDNALAAGISVRDGIRVHRFETAFPRGRYFNDLHRRLLRDYAAGAAREPAARLAWRSALAEEFIRFQGPWCPGLIDHLATRHDTYSAVLFCTYLYPTTHFGLQAIPRAKRILVPTLHDESPAYLRAYADSARASAQLIWLTQAERALGRRLWDVDRGAVVGMAVEPGERDATAGPASDASPYLLYCGRIDESKGCRELLDAFVALRRDHATPVRLVFTGADHLGLPQRDDIEFLGFVDAARKASLMAGAAAFVMPSPYESFSIATLEAMAHGAPVIANAQCAPLAEHVERSGAGRLYRTRAELVAAMRDALASPPDARRTQGERARRYVEDNYTREAVRERLAAAVAETIEAATW